MTQEQRLLTDADVAELLGVTKRTIIHWRYEGRALPPGFKLVGQWRYRPQDVARWLDEQVDMAHGGGR
jgi:DNA-binding transcriptional MerR regulator